MVGQPKGAALRSAFRALSEAVARRPALPARQGEAYELINHLFSKGRKMKTKEKTIDGKRYKITQAGYVYRDGSRITSLPLHPLYCVARIPDGPDDLSRLCFDWIRDNYTMVNS